MKFRNKILLAICGIVLGLQLMTLVLIRYWVREQVQDRFEEELRSNYSIVSEITLLRERQDVRACQVIAESPRLKAVAELRDQETALRLSQELHHEIGSDLLVLTDASGQALVQLIGENEQQFPVAGFHTITEALRLRPAGGVWVVRGIIYRVATVPVVVVGEPVGTLTIGSAIGNGDVALLKSMTRSDIVLVHDTTVVISTSPLAPGSGLSHWIAEGGARAPSPTASVFPIELPEDDYVATLFRMTSEEGLVTLRVAYLLVRSVQKEVDAALDPVLRAFTVLSILVLMVAGGVGYFISMGITRPIGSLVQGTAEVSRGNYDYQIDVHSGGELGFLAQKFEEMSRALKEKLTQLNERNVALEQALNTLQETQGRFQAILDTSPAMVFVKDLQGKYLLVNRKFETVFKVKEAEIAGRADSEVFPERTAEVLRVYDDEVLKGGTVVAWEQVLTHASQPQSYISNKFALFDATGSVYGVCGVLTDVTERKILEEQLRQAQKLESLGTIAGGIAHDFNNILAIILAHATLLDRRTDSPDRLAQTVESITKAVERGTNLVRQLLTFARKTDVRFESIDVNLIIEEMVQMLQATFPKNITFAKNLDNTLPSITADGNQLHQALLNLSVNARDVMPHGGELSFRTGIESGESVRGQFPNASEPRYLQVSVSDTGTGMDEQTKQRIFEPFFTTKGVGKGTGLGLAVVYGVVNSHHGFTTVDSEIGRGTTFHLYFPAPLTVISPHGAGTRESAAVMGGSETILLVEDEEMLLDLLVTLLESKGYRVLRAGDGIEALEVLLENKDTIELVVTDLGLPKLGGWELVKKIRALDPGVNMIVASGYFDPDARTEAVKAGANVFVQKPYIPTEVLKKIREVLDGKG